MGYGPIKCPISITDMYDYVSNHTPLGQFFRIDFPINI